MIDVIELILSRDMRRALRESGRVFTDMEKAVIIFRAGLPLLQRRALLEELAIETDDELVREQVRWSLDDEQRILDWFQKVDDGYIFGVHVSVEGEFYKGYDFREGYEYPEIFDDYFFAHADNRIDACFDTYQVAYESGRSTGYPFEIQKWPICSSVLHGESQFGRDRFCSSLRFDRKGEMQVDDTFSPGYPVARIWGTGWPQLPSNTKPKRWPDALFFERRWLGLPNLYEKGDVVRLLGSELRRTELLCSRGECSYMASEQVVVDSEWAPWTKRQQIIGQRLQKASVDAKDQTNFSNDYWDACIHVLCPCLDGSMLKHAVSPMFLEKIAVKTGDDGRREERTSVGSLRKRQADSPFRLIERGQDEAADALMNSFSSGVIALVIFFNEPGAYVEQILYFLTAGDCFAVVSYDHLTEEEKDWFNAIRA